jgi:hypothetical protein
MASLREGGTRFRRGDELDERFGGIRFLCGSHDAARSAPVGPLIGPFIPEC